MWFEKLLPEIEAFDDLLVFVPIVPSEVLEQFPALADELEQTPAGVMVPFMGLEMLGQQVDTLGQDSHLNRRGTGIGPVDPEIVDKRLFLIFFFNSCHYFLILPLYWEPF